MDNFLLFLLLWGMGSAPYVLPFIISKLYGLVVGFVWWKPKVGRWYYDTKSKKPYLIIKADPRSFRISLEEQSGLDWSVTWPQFRRSFKRKPVTLRTRAKGYAQSAKKLSKKRLTYRELQSRNILLDNEVKRLHAEIKVLRVNPGLRQRFGAEVTVEASTEPAVLEEVSENGHVLYSREDSVKEGALRCAKDLKKEAEATAPFFIRVWGSEHLPKEYPMYLIFGEEPSLVVHHKTLELLKPFKPKEASAWCQRNSDGSHT